jgi:hypothetical protein
VKLVPSLVSDDGCARVPPLLLTMVIATLDENEPMAPLDPETVAKLVPDIPV